MKDASTAELLSASKNSVKVYYDMISSHAATHFADTPQLKGLVIQLLQNTNLTKDKEHFEYDFKKLVGKSDLIATKPGDEIIYAKRLNRDNYTRFIMNTEPADSSVITVVLYKHDDYYELCSTWVGLIVPSFPTAPTATADSVPFWKEHALVWGTQEIQPGTETKVWPWS